MVVMVGTERTPEERKLFYDERLCVLNALTEVQDYDPKTDADANKKAMIAIVDTLGTCDNLVSICGNLAGLAVRRGEVRIGPEKEAPQRAVTLRDIRILGAALRSLLKETYEVNAPETPEVIRVRKALSRVNPAQLFHSAIYGGRFRYWVRTTDRNGVSAGMQRERYFGGIPEDKFPIRTIDVRRGNLMEKIAVPDLGMYPDNAQRIYEILKVLEVEQPTVDLPLRAGDKDSSIVGRVVNRAGEAEFFLNHLPKGLKPWAETKTI